MVIIRGVILRKPARITFVVFVRCTVLCFFFFFKTSKSCSCDIPVHTKFSVITLLTTVFSKSLSFYLQKNYEETSLVTRPSIHNLKNNSFSVKSELK